MASDWVVVFVFKRSPETACLVEWAPLDNGMLPWVAVTGRVELLVEADWVPWEAISLEVEETTLESYPRRVTGLSIEKVPSILLPWLSNRVLYGMEKDPNHLLSSVHSEEAMEEVLREDVSSFEPILCLISMAASFSDLMGFLGRTTTSSKRLK